MDLHQFLALSDLINSLLSRQSLVISKEVGFIVYLDRKLLRNKISF